MDRPKIREAATQPIAASSGVVTDSTKPEASAVVTREQRIVALGAVYPQANNGALWQSEQHWVCTGEDHPQYTKHLMLPRIAQAIADAEARGRASRDEEVERLRGEIARLREITTEEEPEKPGELDRLNPYKRGWVDNPAPAEQPANFIHGIRYYLGMLEDGDDWSHSLGHIESLCKDFRAVTDARAGKAQVPAVTDEQLAKDIAVLRRYYPTGNAASGELPWEQSLARITAAFAGRGVR
jgi:hypothetical protein